MLSGWAKTGLFPFCPLKVLKDIQRPPAELRIPKGDEGIQVASPICETLKTLLIPERSAASTAAEDGEHGANVNNESNRRKSVMPLKVGEGHMMSYGDIVEAQEAKRVAKGAATQNGQAWTEAQRRCNRACYTDEAGEEERGRGCKGRD
ncbi:unnamed protein product [Alternaria alternata]